MATDISRQLMTRMQRMETRMIRGFEELGARVVDDDDWFQVDHEKHIVHLKSLGKSISAVRAAMKHAGCNPDITYDISVGGAVVCSIYLGGEDGVQT